MNLVTSSINDPNATRICSDPVNLNSKYRVAVEIECALGKRAKLVEELESIDRHVRRLKVSLPKHTRKSRFPHNFETRVHQSSSGVRAKRMLSLNVEEAVEKYRPLRVFSPRSSSPLSVPTHASMRRRAAMQGSKEGKLEIFHEGGSAGSMDNLPILPQYIHKSILEKLEDCCRISISRPTVEIDLIAPWVPEGPRSVHQVFSVPARRQGFFDRRKISELRSKWLHNS